MLFLVGCLVTVIFRPSASSLCSRRLAAGGGGWWWRVCASRRLCVCVRMPWQPAAPNDEPRDCFVNLLHPTMNLCDLKILTFTSAFVYYRKIGETESQV